MPTVTMLPDMRRRFIELMNLFRMPVKHHDLMVHLSVQQFRPADWAFHDGNLV